MPVLLEERVAVAVERALEQENGRVEALIQAAIDKQFADLVALELEARTERATYDAPDGLMLTNQAEVGEASASYDAPTKTCRRCGESKPAGAFDKGRATMPSLPARAAPGAATRTRGPPRGHQAREDRSGEPPRPDSHGTQRPLSRATFTADDLTVDGSYALIDAASSPSGCSPPGSPSRTEQSARYELTAHGLEVVRDVDQLHAWIEA